MRTLIIAALLCQFVLPAFGESSDDEKLRKAFCGDGPCYEDFPYKPDVDFGVSAAGEMRWMAYSRGRDMALSRKPENLEPFRVVLNAYGADCPQVNEIVVVKEG